eukprot:SAG25_NODE_107_length_15283_cov_3.516728_7_plen_116_part_00
MLGVHDAQGSQLFSIVGPCLYCDGPCCDVTFEVRHPDVRGEAVGELRRHGETLTPAQVRARPCVSSLAGICLRGVVFLVAALSCLPGGAGPSGRRQRLHARRGAAGAHHAAVRTY